MGVTDHNETGLRPVRARDAGHAGRQFSPRAKNARDAMRGPNGVVNKAPQVSPAARFQLMTLWDGGSGAAMSDQKRVEPGIRCATAGLADQLTGKGSVLTPRHDVIEGDVTMGDQDGATGQFMQMDRGDIRIMIAGKHPDLGRTL